MLVTVLTSVMIIGFIVLIIFLVTRFPDDYGPLLPEQINLPKDVRAVAYTQADNWFAVVTDDDRILVFDRTGNRLIQTVDIVQTGQ